MDHWFVKNKDQNSNTQFYFLSLHLFHSKIRIVKILKFQESTYLWKAKGMLTNDICVVLIKKSVKGHSV